MGVLDFKLSNDHAGLLTESPQTAPTNKRSNRHRLGLHPRGNLEIKATLMPKQTEPHHTTPSLGTELRRLIELLDGDVEKHYRALGLEYRPRFTPIVRALETLGPSSIKSIARQSGLSHSAVSQTVAQMVKYHLLAMKPGGDGRERIVEPTITLVQMLPVLHIQWAATKEAAGKLEAELSASLLKTVGEAICALQRHSFGDRITEEFKQLRRS